MDDIILFTIPLPFIQKDFVLTAWKLVGFTGMALFTSRWFVQIAASRRQKKPVLPILFWYLSLAGSSLMLAYFIFGKNDAVGILSNLFPATVSLYNLYLEFTGRSKNFVKAEAPNQPVA